MNIAIVSLIIAVFSLVVFGFNQWRINNNFIDALTYMQNQIDILAEQNDAYFDGGDWVWSVTETTYKISED